MRILLLSLLFCTTLYGYPGSGVANNAIRIPSTGGIPKAGPLDISKSAAVTGLTTNRIPFWNGAAGVGLGDTTCTWNSGTSTLTCTKFNRPSPGSSDNYPSSLAADSSGNFFYIDTNPSVAQVVSDCTSSPCSFTQRPNDQSPVMVTSITRASTGVYTVNFTAGYWTATPICTVNRHNANDGRRNCYMSAQSTSSLSVNCYSQNSADDGSFDVLCFGVRHP